jgi:Ulp1 family protease
MQDEAGMTEHLAEGPEERGHGTTMTMVNLGQNTKDVPEATTQEQAVKEREVDESETLLEEEGGKNTALGGVHENRDLETKEDRRIQPSSDERREKSNDVRQGAQLLTPVEIAKNIAERDYISKTLTLLPAPKYDQSTNIVSAYDVVITRGDLARLQTGTKLNDGNIDWMLRWWAGQVNGGFGKKPPPSQPNQQLPRCYFSSTYWYVRMTSEGTFSYESVKSWTATKILQEYDLMIIPINVPTRDHWILAVIDLKKRKTTIYDSAEQDTTRPAHPEIHKHLMAWLMQEHLARNLPFNAKEWEAIRSQQTPQQGYGKDVGIDCGVFVIAYAMYLSTNRPFGFSQTDMPSLRNWIAQTMVGYGIGNNTFDPMKDDEALESESSRMDRWTLLVKD